MNKHEELIYTFYTAFQQLDADTMVNCYHPDASFKDPVFELHSKEEIAKMWNGLCKRAKKFELNFDQVKANESTGLAHWEATYLFSKTNRMVTNSINAEFRYKDGLIIEHIDSFDFWKWSRQALGLTGYLLGWSSFLRSKVQKQAMKSLK
ncbi:nuclear transport factor 2 family protein [Gracilimonas mengyeensis]|uniref:SnoaL-like domain-containing protein n=1 Tax=Gracilimonas mengyeensis TaxID=1302730 RepID=A0A521DZN4_9BACT|nr:nuclear transport factor 2 family protein [Gracilimonas mengyeensis]SMO77164.1 SnoaL-like domain-containing protein [Gracilimonas mengyeensis]